MYALLSDDAKKRTSLARLQRTLRAGSANDHARSASPTGALTDDRHVPGDAPDAHLRHAARARSRSRSVSARSGDPGVDWRAELVYPGLHRGEKLRRETTLPERATIQARDGTAIAKGPDRLSDLGPLACEIVGTRRSRPARAGQGARRARRPGRCAGRPDRPRARVRRAPLGHPRRRPLRRRARAGARSSRPRAAPCARRSTRSSSAPRSRRWPAATAGSRSCSRAPARCWRWPASPSRRPSRRAARSRSSRSPACCDNKIAKRNSTYPVHDRRDDRGRRDPERQRRVLRRHAADLLRALLQQRLRAAGREARRAEARRDGPEVRLQPGPGPDRRRALHDPRRRRRSATTSRSARPRSARARCWPRRWRWRSWRRRSAPTACGPRPRCSRATTPSRPARDQHRRGEHDQELHAHRRHRRHGRRGRAARREGRGQDRHRRAAHDGQGRAAARGHRPQRAAAGGRHDRHRRVVRRLRAATRSRRSPSRCCSSARARAATPPRPPRAPSSPRPSKVG